MPDVQEEVERYLAVGRVAVLQTEPQRKDGPRFATSVIGWRRGRAIFIEHPKTPEGRDVAFRDAQPCVVRFVHEGQACAFSSDILDWSAGRGETQVRLRWPIQMERLALRRFERVVVQCPCRVTLSTGKIMDGTLHDISVAGCGLAAPVVISKSDTLIASFTLPDGTVIEGLALTVRTARPVADGSFLGCEIATGQERARNDVALFVTSALARGRVTGGPAATRVLIVDSDIEFTEKVKRLLVRQGIEAVSVTCTLDAMHALRALPVQGVLVNQQLADLPGLELCRLVRAARGLETLPLVLFGGESGLADAAGKVGAQKHLPNSPSLLSDLAYETKRVVQAAVNPP